jgi:hypothetical protein
MPPKKEYITIKILKEHYKLVKNNKKNTGVNIDFFIGQAITEKLSTQKTRNKK